MGFVRYSVAAFGFALSVPSVAQMPIQTGGTIVVMPAFGEVRHVNDEAHATFMVEEQDKDKATAASRVNRQMKQGTEIIRRLDPQAKLKTRGYYTYAVYADEQIKPRQDNKTRQPIGWRVGQYLEVTTQELDDLPKMVASAQQVLALNGLYFGLTQATSRKLEEQRIAAAYQNLSDRIVAAAKAMGRDPSDAVLQTVDFEASGAYAEQDMRAAKTMRATPMAAEPVAEPSFEPGETTLNMRIVGKVKFK